MNEFYNRETAVKVLAVVDAGLCGGLGRPVAGECCIIAAKRLACGLSHGDGIDGLPIGSAVRSFEIALNDCGWSSRAARAAGMRKLSVAEWGSDQINQAEFSERLAVKVVKKLFPEIFRRIAEIKELPPEHQKTFGDLAEKCERVVDAKTMMESDLAALAARDALDALAARAALAALAALDALDALAALAALAARADLADRADLAALAALAARDARAAIAALAAIAARADLAALAARDALNDERLKMVADLAVDTLREMDCPGCEWLDLCEDAAA